MGLAEGLKAAFGNAVHKADEDFWHKDILPTGLPYVDHALGGGFGYGCTAEVFGNWSSGKTMILYYALANNQKLGGLSFLFESEGAFHPDFFRMMGGDPSKLEVMPVKTVEEVFDAVVTICAVKKKGKDTQPVALGWDSIAMTGTRHLQATDSDTRDMSKANAMNEGCQRIGDIIREYRIAFIATNQIRDKIGSEDPEPHTPGGKAWMFLASQRLWLKFDGGTKGSLIMSRDGNREIGRSITGYVCKNKLASPFGRFEASIYTKAGEWHPFYEYGTSIGMDSVESLFWNYYNQKIMPKSLKPIITMPSNGWYQVSDEFAPSDYKKFQKADWPEVVKEIPKLYTLVYDLKKPSTADTASSAS